MTQTNPLVRKVVKGTSYLRRHGVRMTTARLLQGMGNQIANSGKGKGKGSIPLEMLVKFSDAAALDWASEPHWKTEPRAVGEGPYTTAWIMSPPGESSGGHQNIFRFLSYLEAAGHRVKIFLYWAQKIPVDAQRVRDMVERSSAYPSLKASYALYDPPVGVGSDVDAIFATGWETAYPAYLDPSNARRFYFVQDFEPSFYPVGSENQLAENTYRFGFEAFTAGKWLAKRLHDDYGMTTHPFDFATDLSLYQRTNDARRKDLFFYSRPVTMRRGFELGCIVLADVKKRRPDIRIHMAGWDVSDWKVPFDYVNHGAMKLEELSPLYNQCAAALVMSLTNLSLLPLELLSCGTIPVVNDGPNNRLVADNPNIDYVPLSPGALATELIRIVDASDQVELSRRAAASVKSLSWEDSGRRFVSDFAEAMHV
ncbi:glycosyltransferase [Schaalia meyeri]|uniref:Glycosyltransferase n=1 Tax=Schaalia meyeri TaxID=52773 RepID=A0AAP9Y8I6_9ACTO|nr:glycosyltransferase [Schaalia meyeri]QQC44076.1 glycosyltransferase [Schaalia meyeri]